MSKKTSYGLFILFFTAFWLHWVLQRNGYHFPLVHAYMDDFICIPVLLFPLLMLYRKWLMRSEVYTFPPAYVLLAWVVLSLAFEVVLPGRSPGHTSDPMDMLMYALGGALFWYMQKPFGPGTGTVSAGEGH